MWYNDRDDDEGFWEPYATHESSHESREGAIEDAKNWATNEELRYLE